MQSKIQMMIIGRVNKSMQEIMKDLTEEDKIEIVDACNDCLLGIKKAKSKKVDIILLDIEVEGINESSATALIKMNFPNTLIIALAYDKNNGKLKEALVSGADEYIVQPSKNELVKTITHLFEKESMKNQSNMDEPSKIISVFNTKGGVGRSILSANLSIALKHLTQKPVGLMDLDFEYGDISLIMNICPQFTLQEIKEKLPHFNQNSVKQYFIEHYCGVDVFTVLNEGQDMAISDSELLNILLLAKTKYQYILMDMSPVLSPMNMTALRASDYILLMTTLELSSIKNTVQALNALKSLNVNSEHIYIVLNRFERHLGIGIDEIKKFVGKEDVFIIPEDKKTVVQSVNSGRPFVMSKKNASISKSIMDLARKVISENEKWGVRDEIKEIGG